MNVEAVSLQNTAHFELSKAADQTTDTRKKVADLTDTEVVEKKQAQSEELLQQIKALTEDGLYSVRFENDNDAGEMIVKVVDRETDEVIRQIPPEELLDLTKRLNDLRGNIVNTEG